MVIKRINKTTSIQKFLLIKLPISHYMSQQISATFRDVQKVIKILHLQRNSSFATILMLPLVFHIAEYKTP
jgi:hypothetical protein